ncbi:DUF2179 domain-containing protein [Brevibacillus humidisoli]|uniref:DUF2179 domain-containing protein n=1 Tax=Brevibacillus humidisoli TaxID=2895522 RepID=UPI001E485879|nr:DUF2179 domain-containing protein [Brevibacillus humidisoli]UFJ41689.1 DUF2179 domain-containing protein [Brevibacillus humidisoli]
MFFSFLLVFTIQISYMTLYTMRMIFMMRGLRYAAAGISFAEVGVYLIGLGIVLNNLEDPWNLFAYCAGFASGILVGSKIEERLALGYVTVKVIAPSPDDPNERPDFHLADELRKAGFGVTSWLGQGRDGKRLVMEILTKRTNQAKLMELIITWEPRAFVISHEPSSFKGGFWVKQIRP